MAPIGTVTSSVGLNKQDFQGQNDAIEGTVTLTFQPNGTSTGQELFGPLKVNVVLQGRMKLQVAENRTSHAYIWHYETVPLFSKNTAVFDGPLRLPANGAHVVYFSTRFPRTVDYWHGRQDVLPPTFITRFSASAPKQAGKHQGATSIEYSLKAELDMPGIDVELSAQEPPLVIQYQPPSRISSRSHGPGFSKQLQVKTYDLLPEDERPNSLFDTTKAVLKNVSRPIYAFTAICDSTPEHISIEEPISMNIRVQTDAKETTATSAPEIELLDCKLELLARTQMYATNAKGFDSPKLDATSIMSSLELTKQNPVGPFAKSNDYGKILTFVTAPSDTPSSFSISKLSRSYRMRMLVRFSVAGQVILMKHDWGVVVMPPHSLGAAPAYEVDGDPGPVAGPSRVKNEEVLPSYEA